ncbi:MAG: helix-turn-helix transcriptional regulator, partial [Flavobacteriales bacterium]
MNVLSETVEMLKQFKDFSLFSELGGIIQRLEDKVYTEKTKQSSIIHLDKNENLKGLEHLDVLYQAILKKLCLTITYQSFKAAEPTATVFHPFLLKEYNNRWFIVGKKKKSANIITFALDRIHSIEYNLDVPYVDEEFDGDDYYSHTIGVTVLPKKHVKDVVLRVDTSNAPYVITKPFHSSQEILEHEGGGGIVIKLRVDHNYELERMILGFGETIEVIKPRNLRYRIKKKLEVAALIYE